jgi:hypothetical protein
MTNQHKLTFLNTAARLMDALATLDEVHTATSEGTIETPNTRGQAELVAMLREIAYVAGETAQELDGQHVEPVFRLVKGFTRQADYRSEHSDDLGKAGDPSPRNDRGFRVLVAEKTTSLPLTLVKRAGG